VGSKRKGNGSNWVEGHKEMTYELLTGPDKKDLRKIRVMNYGNLQGLLIWPTRWEPQQANWPSQNARAWPKFVGKLLGKTKKWPRHSCHMRRK